MPKIKQPLFSTNDALARVQTEIICALLRLIPRENPEVPINKMHRFLNPNSGLPDGFLVENVRLVNDGHNVIALIRQVDYEKLDQTIHDVTEIDENTDTRYLQYTTETFVLNPRSDEWTFENIALLKLIYDEAEKAISKK